MNGFSLRARALTLAGGSMAALLVAFYAQFFGGLAPCVLCIYQRWPYAAAILLALLAAMLGPVAGGRLTRLLLRLAGLALLITAAIGVFHSGVEYGWWQGTAECGSTIGATSLADLKAALESAPVVRCDQTQWSLLGISIAGYNVLYALGLAVVCLVGLSQADADRSRR